MSSDFASRLAVVIPAYRPSAALVDVVRALSEKGMPAIVLVDDGSGPEYRDVFLRAAAFPGAQLLRHATNLGKGAALKTGINFALCTFPELAGIVTADADGQHHPDDIERVAQTLMAHPEYLVLGSRTFDADVPFRSRIGNLATSAVMHALLGQKLADTQTGLRGIPARLLLHILRLEATGYEFELEMLLAAHHMSIRIVEEPIRTIYEPGNKSSHFNPVTDSMKIYFVLLRFGSVSFLSAVLDNVVFYLAYRHFAHVLVSQVLGRLFGVAFNYSMVRSSVFYSKQQHKAVLPKYLALVVASGTVSYAGIRLLSGKLGLSPVSAKLTVETLLFFVNFTVQRMLIFKAGEPVRGESGAASEDRAPGSGERRAAVGTLAPGREAGDASAGAPPGRGVSWLVWAIVIGALGLAVYGFSTAHLFSQYIWSEVGLKRFGRFAGMYLAVAAPILVLAPWSFPGLIAGLVLCGTAISVGPQPLLAAAFFLVSACALGSRLLGRTKGDTIEQQACATLLGTGAYIFLMTLVARLPVNYAPAWGVLLAVPVLADLGGVWRRLVELGALLRHTRLRSWGERAAFALVVFILLAHWFVALTPEASADGLAIHLAVPVNIAVHHAMTYQPGRFLWSVMPMGGDFIYTIAYLLGGEYAAHLMDYALLLLVAALLYAAVRRSVTRAVAYLLVALFAATPLVYLVTGSLFVENLLAAMVVGMMTGLRRFAESGEKKFLYLAAVLGGTAMATKFGAMAFFAMALPVAAWEVRRHWKMLGPRPVAVCLLAAMLFLATGMPAYAIAWWKTGNPLFPFLNQRFHSRLLDPAADIQDVRYRQPLGWNTLYDITFHSSKTYEGQDGSAGFQYLLLAPLAAVAILFLKRRQAAGAAIVALGAGILIMGSATPNTRYLYPALALLVVPFAALLGWARGRRRLYPVLIAVTVACIGLDLWFLPSGSYYHKDFCLRLPFSRAERARAETEGAPIRDVIAYYNRTHPHSTVMLASGAETTGLEGEIYENHWHQFSTLDQLRRTSTVPQVAGLIRQWKVQYLIAHKPDPGDPLRPLTLKSFLERCTAPEYEYGDVYLARVEPECKPESPPPPRAPTVTVGPGFYDDFDPAVVFRGDWLKDDRFEGPARHTISFTDAPGAEVSLMFEGAALTYVFTRAPNRGIAVVSIDGDSKGDIDLYAPNIEWQTKRKFCCLGKGRHIAIIRIAGQNPKSAGQFIDLDAFVVE